RITCLGIPKYKESADSHFPYNIRGMTIFQPTFLFDAYLNTFEFDFKSGKIECMDMKGNSISKYFECGDFVEGYKIGICTEESVKLHECQFIAKNTLDNYLREISWLGGEENGHKNPKTI
ncbi:MAG: hypothetical protein KH031_29820, partial [Clostridiales bacterium]|nr:hypothetical protein [Clostridiales bacterium]